jgi:hypothetical protein
MRYFRLTEYCKMTSLYTADSSAVKTGTEKDDCPVCIFKAYINRSAQN